MFPVKNVHRFVANRFAFCMSEISFFRLFIITFYTVHWQWCFAVRYSMAISIIIWQILMDLILWKPLNISMVNPLNMMFAISLIHSKLCTKLKRKNCYMYCNFTHVNSIIKRTLVELSSNPFIWFLLHS